MTYYMGSVVFWTAFAKHINKHINHAQKQQSRHLNKTQQGWRNQPRFSHLWDSKRIGGLV